MCVVPTLQALADAFRVNESVTKVDLADNYFGDEGLKARGHGWWFMGTIMRGDGCSAAEVLYEA